MSSVSDSEKYYNDLKIKILAMPYNQTFLQKLKMHFKGDINSNRTFDKIHNIKNLINILEKRDVLSIDNLFPLIKIQSLLEPCMNTNPNMNRPIQNNNLNQSNAINRVNNYNIGITEVNSRIPCDPECKRKIYDTISNEIGQRWKNFARKMNVNEGSIDDFEERCANIHEKVHLVLRFHEANCDPNYWRSELLNGLYEARRKDLRDKVEKIFAIHRC